MKKERRALMDLSMTHSNLQCSDAVLPDESGILYKAITPRCHQLHMLKTIAMYVMLSLMYVPCMLLHHTRNYIISGVLQSRVIEQSPLITDPPKPNHGRTILIVPDSRGSRLRCTFDYAVSICASLPQSIPISRLYIVVSIILFICINPSLQLPKHDVLCVVVCWWFSPSTRRIAGLKDITCNYYEICRRNLPPTPRPPPKTDGGWVGTIRK